MDKKIFVTKPSMPNLEDYTRLLQMIWKSGQLTNDAAMHSELEEKLCEYLKVEHISLQANGTLALWSALRAAECHGEVITTPFSFIATAHSLLLNNLTPVFVDIDPETLSINPSEVERAITDKTSAILAVHCYGNPSALDELEYLAEKYGLKLIYDAAHAFGVSDNNGSILKRGDYSAVSFHATKVFSTIEGGAVICRNFEQKQKLDQIKNFGIKGEEEIPIIGINAKMSEVHAAFGILQLENLNKNIEKRKNIYTEYKDRIGDLKYLQILVNQKERLTHNYSYLPLLVKDNEMADRDVLIKKLADHGIIARKYFFPLITNTLSYRRYVDKKDFPVAEYMSNSVICLPIYPDLEIDDVRKICSIIRSAYD